MADMRISILLVLNIGSSGRMLQKRNRRREVPGTSGGWSRPMLRHALAQAQRHVMPEAT
jgi:hypothetical protein